MEGVRRSLEGVIWSWEVVRLSLEGVRWTWKVSDDLGNVSDGLWKVSDSHRKVSGGLESMLDTGYSLCSTVYCLLYNVSWQPPCNTLIVFPFLEHCLVIWTTLIMAYDKQRSTNDTTNRDLTEGKADLPF